MPFPFVTPVFDPFGEDFANNTVDPLRDPTTAIWSAERGDSWHVYSSSMVCRGALPRMWWRLPSTDPPLLDARYP